MNRASQLITAIRGMADNIEIQEQLPDGLFGRVAIIESGSVNINSNELDLEFEVPFDDNVEANEAEITVYNLSKTTVDALKFNNPISITAGYKDDTGVIFSGYISKVTTKEDGLDKTTKIYAIDSENLKERDIVELEFSAGTSASYILKDLISRVSLPLAAFNPRRDWIYKDSVKIDGGLMDNIQKYAEVCGISVYINKGKIYARHISEGDNINFNVSAETGLIESPEEFEEEVTAEDYNDIVKGYRLTMILQHRMTTAAIINLQSKDVSGQYRVRSGKHIFNDGEAITEIEVI